MRKCLPLVSQELRDVWGLQLRAVEKVSPRASLSNDQSAPVIWGFETNIKEANLGSLVVRDLFLSFGRT